MELLIEQPGLQDLHLALQQLKENQITFDEAVIHLIRSHGLTWNAAADRIRGAEAITGIWLDGDSPELARSARSALANASEAHAGSFGRLPAQVGAADHEETSAQEPSTAIRSEAAPHPHGFTTDDDAEAKEAARNAETLFCTICGDPIPEPRARRQTAACSETCKNRLDTIRAKQREAKRCPHCLHPSTPEERASFRQWRAARGDMQTVNPVTRDRSMASKYAMRKALRRAITALSQEKDTLAASLDQKLMQTKAEASKGHLGVTYSARQRAQAEAKLETLTTLIRDCEELATPQPPTA